MILKAADRSDNNMDMDNTSVSMDFDDPGMVAADEPENEEEEEVIQGETDEQELGILKHSLFNK